MLRPTLAALAFAALTACGGSAPPPASGGSASSASATRVEVGEMTLGDDKKTVKIHADGTIEAPDGKPMGTVTAQGEIIVQGKTVATLAADGTVSMGEGAKESATISEDGVLTFKTKSETFTASIGADGAVAGTNPSAGKLVIKGADTAGKKRAAMLVLVVVVTSKGPAPAAPTVAP